MNLMNLQYLQDKKMDSTFFNYGMKIFKKIFDKKTKLVNIKSLKYIV